MSGAINSSKVCIVIPAFNEEKVIGKLIREAKKAFRESQYTAELLVVNDGSQDNTELEAKKAGATVINHILNFGVGSATATGLSYAQRNNFSLAATMDADGQHAIKDVLNGINKISRSNIDLLIGSRLIDKRGMSRVKVIGNKGLSFITYILFGVNSTDSQSGLRIYSRSALEQLKWKTSGYEFCSEMLWRAKQLRLNIDEYPIKAIYSKYSKVKGQNNWNSFNIVKSLIRHRIADMFE